ncbi:nucleotidyltransferase domain-containing protein [Streptomyces incanus]|uniref:Nucleotidyltransferase domain-containing protein n=1 Tax=Streptomyces incanus TaxID=887453 RepID=A0ABW0XJZ1_9ACTN
MDGVTAQARPSVRDRNASNRATLTVWRVPQALPTARTTGSPTASSPSTPQHLPAELCPCLRELLRRTHTVCGPYLVSVPAVGSVALGDYRHGRSDVDVTVVVDPSLPGGAPHEPTGALAHPALPCPAAGLELAV